jgi:hypothetical protein
MNWLSLSGWAMEKSSLTDLLPRDSQVTEVDYHFFSNGLFPDKQDLESLIPEGPYSMVCYSMGTLSALELCGFKLPERLICISGFAHFPGDGRDGKRRKLNILQMIKGIKNDSAKTLNDFTKQAGLKMPTPEFINEDNLIKGLELLKDGDMCLAAQNNNLKLLSIYGSEDRIVSKPINDQLMTDRGECQKVVLAGGHGIIQTHVNKIQDLIRNF